MTNTRTGGSAMVPVSKDLSKISVHPRMSAKSLILSAISSVYQLLIDSIIRYAMDSAFPAMIPAMESARTAKFYATGIEK